VRSFIACTVLSVSSDHVFPILADSGYIQLNKTGLIKILIQDSDQCCLKCQLELIQIIQH
jgi:hypothetical protein